MKENVIDVLMFLFDNYLLEEGMLNDEVSLTCELQEAGFEVSNINKAFDWLGELADINRTDFALVQAPGKAIRVYLPQEQLKLDVNCRGFLHQIENMRLLDIASREMIIDRAMAIDSEELNLTQFKRIVGLVLLNSGSYEGTLNWIEDLIYDESESVLH